jgi:outer membrane cobalamin receptor
MRRFCFCRHLPHSQGATGAKATEWTRSIRYFALLIAVALCFTLAQSPHASPAVGTLSGIVTDKEGIPVPRATIRVVGTSFDCASDDLGRFLLPNLPIGTHSILITAVGYDSHTVADVRLSEDASSAISVQLTRRPVPLGGMVIADSALSALPNPEIEISREQIEKSHSRTVAEALELQSGIQVVGSSGTVSIRGSSPEHVVILVDGQRVAPASSGMSTLDGIPLERVERIEIHKGGASALVGPDAVGGVIAITTRNPRDGSSRKLDSRASSRYGSYDLTLWSGHVNLPELYRRLSISADIAQEGYGGDFPFHYNAPGRNTVFDGYRVNNRTRSESWHSSLNWLAGTKTNVRLNGQVYNGRNGLPNRASRQDSSGYRTDHRFMLYAEILHAIAKTGTIAFRSGWNDQTQYFNDANDPVAANRYESRFNDKTGNVSAEVEKQVWTGGHTRVGVEQRFSHIDHSDILRPLASSGESRRWQTLFWSFIGQRFVIKGLHPLDAVTLSSAWHYDRVSTEKVSQSAVDSVGVQRANALSPLYSMAVTIAGRVRFTAHASYGKSLRIPSVNALFWKGDVRSRGNPFLRPERAEHSEAGVRGMYQWRRHSVEVDASYFHTHVSSAIIWQPGQGEVWRPENIGSSLTTGHEESAIVSLFDEFLTFGYRNAVLSAHNKTEGANSYDKYLTYSPEYITSLSARFSWRWMWCDWRTRLVGRRWANVANTASYPGYRVDDAGLGVNLSLASGLEASADLRIDNIFDEDFVVVTHYPMPGRQSSISLTLTYGAM